jgi:hypothetical protein
MAPKLKKEERIVAELRKIARLDGNKGTKDDLKIFILNLHVFA